VGQQLGVLKMIDVKLIRENPEMVREALQKRGADVSVLESFLKVDKEWRTLTTQLGKKRKEKNEYSLKISKAQQGEKEKLISESDTIAKEIDALETSIKEKEQERNYLLSLLPNIPHPTAPIGIDESCSVVVRTWKEIPKYNFNPKDHIDIATKLDIVDVERASKVSGARFYYLKNEAVMMEFALINYVSNLLIKNNFKPVIPPVLVRERSLFGTGFLPTGRNDVYKIENEDLFLVGTAEVPLGAMHMDEVFKYSDLPLWYFGFSSCFRTEAGAHGKDTKGIFRVHQFDKIEMFKFTLPEKGEEEHEHLIKMVETIFQGLEIPYRIINICTGDLGPSAAKKYDLEAYLPGQGKYREMASCSLCTDYQARRLNIKFVDKNNAMRYVYTLNSTAVAIGRAIVAIIENNQEENGSIRVPKVLQPYMNIDKISPKG